MDSRPKAPHPSRRRARGLVVLAAPCLLAAGCIPVPRMAPVSIPLEVEVVDPETGDGVAGVEVLQVRYRYPHARADQVHAATTDTQGRARFEGALTREWVMPLMIHGVPFYDFLVAAWAEGHLVDMVSVDETTGRITLALFPDPEGPRTLPEPQALVDRARLHREPPEPRAPPTRVATDWIADLESRSAQVVVGRVVAIDHARGHPVDGFARTRERIILDVTQVVRCGTDVVGCVEGPAPPGRRIVVERIGRRTAVLPGDRIRLYLTLGGSEANAWRVLDVHAAETSPPPGDPGTRER